LKKIVEYFKRRLKGASVEKVKTDLWIGLDSFVFCQESPVAFMHDLHTKTALDKKALQFTYSRLQSLLRTLEITSLEEFNPLQDVANFATLVSTYVDGFSVILEPRVSLFTILLDVGHADSIP
jgi:hypothetical protein